MDSIIRDHEAAWSAAQVPRTCGWRLLPTRLHRAKSTDPPCGSRQSLNNRIHSYEKLYFQRAQDGSNGFLYCPPGHLPAQHQAPGCVPPRKNPLLCSTSGACVEGKELWKRKRSSVLYGRIPATLLPQPSLATLGKLFILRFSQVATNYTLFIFPGALCKTPPARCSEMQNAHCWVWLASPAPRSRVPIWLPSALPPSLGRALISVLFALFFALPCSSPPHFLRGLLPCSAPLVF